MIEQISLYSELWGLSNSIVMNRTDSDYLIDDNGLDWGEITSQLHTIKNLDGLGTTVTAVETVEPRVIVITGWVVGTESEMETKKALLKNVIAPQTTIRIQIPNDEDTHNPYYIDGQLVSSLKFSSTYDQNNEAMCQFSFTIQAPYPFFCLDRFYDNSDYSSILNKGSIPVGVQVIMTSSSAFSNPSISFQRSGYTSETFSLSGEYDAGTQIQVDTRKGLRRVLVNGSRGFRGLNSEKWLEVPVSNSPIIVRASEDIVSLRFSEAHTVLKGM